MNHRHFLFSIFFLASASLSSQVTTPLPDREGQGGESFTLAQLRDSALQNNIAMRKARLRVLSAREQSREAFTNYFPNISAVGMTFRANKEMAEMDIDPKEFIPQELQTMMAQALPMEVLMSMNDPVTMSMMKYGTIAGVTALQPVFAGGQIVIGNKLARVGQKASELQLQLSEKDVEAQVEKYYWQLVSMQEKARTLDAVDTMLAQIRHDVETAVRAGVALNNDLLQVQLRQNEIESQRLKLNNGRTLVKMLLAQFCGLNLTPKPHPLTPSTRGEGEVYGGEVGNYLFEIEMPDTSQDILAVVPDASASVSTLPEYQLLEKNVEAARLQRKMEVAKNLPNVAVGAGYNYHNLLDKDRHFAMGFATVSVPITDWWGGAHAIRRKKIAELEAREDLTDNAQKLHIRIQKAANDVSEAESQMALTQRSVELATENLRIQRNTYRAGTSTMSDLLQAQLLLQQACDKHTDAFADYHVRLLEYKHAIGQ